MARGFLQLTDDWLNVLLPQRCLGCDRHAQVLCLLCRTAVSAAPPPAGAVALDEGPIGRFVRTAKHRGLHRAGAPMAELTLERRGEALHSIDSIAWVPPDPRRGPARGTHLPLLYARALARQTGVPSVDLLRRSHRPPQRGSSRRSRLANVDGAFTVAGRLQPGRRVLLLDDVTTTGATLAAAAQPLRDLGATVSCLAFLSVARRGARAEGPL